MIPFLIPIVAELAKNGLGILANAITAKGKDVIEEKLGVKIDDAIQSDEGKLKLMQLQSDHEEFLLDADIKQKTLDIEAQKLAYADTASARDMNTRINESANASWLSKNIASILALGTVCAGFTLLAVSPEEGVRTAAVGLVTMVLGFYFGSTSSSKSKDDAISKLSGGAK